MFKHVFIVMEENTSLTSTLGSPSLSSTNTPYLEGSSGLASQWATSNNYSGVTDPSLPNYIAITSGGTQNITCDCAPTGSACSNPGCSNIFGTEGCNCGGMTVTHLGDQFDGAGLTWKNYGETMGTACNTASSGTYATKHVPFLYYADVLNNSSATYCAGHVLDFTNLATDLAGTTPTFSFITPNLDDDMHGTGSVQTQQDVDNGDTWLSTNLPGVLTSNAFNDDGVVFIVWDEGSLSLSPKSVPFFLLSPLAKHSGYVSSVAYDHYSLLATIEDGLGLTRIGGAATATPLQDFFPSN